MNVFELAPAQILFLRQPSKVKVYELLEATVQDLILKKIVRFERIQSFPNPRSRKTQLYFMLKKGPLYQGYTPKNFEKGFLTPLNEHDKLMTRLVTDYIVKKYSMPASFINAEIYEPLNKDKYISGLPLLKAFGVYSISQKGKELLNDVKQFAEQQKEKFNQNLKDPKAFYQTLQETGWFIFLYKKYDNELYKEIVSVVKRINRNASLGNDIYLDEYLEAFDVNFENHE